MKKRVKQLQASLARSRPHAGDASMGADLSLENEDVDEDTQDQAQDVQDFDHIDSTSDGIEVPEKTSRGEGKRRVVGRAKRNSIADNPMLGKLLAGYDSTNHRHSVDGTRDGNDENVAVSSDGKKTGEEELEGARERAFVKDRLQFKQLKDLGKATCSYHI